MQALLEEQAGLELGAVDTNNILTLLECPVCLDHITPPIKQCIKVTPPPTNFYPNNLFRVAELKRLDLDPTCPFDSYRERQIRI